MHAVVAVCIWKMGIQQLVTSFSIHSSNGLMTGSVDSETNLLRKEVASLNQEMSQVLQRSKDAERGE